ncbi:18575_t:CDS:2, partial [Racocetra fulgida]
ICETLNIEQNNFEIIRSTELLRQEIKYEDTIIEEMAKLIRNIEDSKLIIYCARKKDCEEIRDFLQVNLPNYSLDIYYRENPQLTNALLEILKMLEVVEVLTKNNLTEVLFDDVVDVFSRSNTDKIRKNGYNELTLQRNTKE